MNYFSMFSGIGGFELGIDNSNVKMSCVGYSELDKYASAIYKYHYPNHINYEDATKINTDELPDFDFLIGGFPCQAFSISGKRQGFKDTRGTLFFEIERVLQAKKPKYFLLENVKGLLSHDNRRTFTTIVSCLNKCGYSVGWMVLNSKHFGVPQNRERVFIIGHLGKECAKEIFFETEGNRNDNEKQNRFYRQYTNTLLAKYGNLTGNSTKIVDNGNKLNQVGSLPGYDSNRIYDSNGLAKCITGGSMSGGERGQRTGLYIVDKLSKFQNDSQRGNKGGNTDLFVTNSNIRRLTPKECERLQGFPDDWTKLGHYDEGIKKVSDTQRYKCLGNAVTTNVISWIINGMFKV